MPVLPSGLPEFVSDDEHVARVLRSSNEYSNTGRCAKPNALLPDEKGEKSVFRVSELGEPEIRAVVCAHVPGRMHGVATFKVSAVRREGLEVTSSEPPPRHADIVRWPMGDSDPVRRRALHKSIAQRIIAGQVHCFLWPPSP